MFTLYYKQRGFRLYNRGSEKSMKRALIITTVSGFVPQFEMNNVKILQNLGYEVHYAANYHMPVYTDNNERLEGTGIIQHQIDFVRSPYKIGKNIKALNQLVSLMRETKFHLVHCHTPMGGVLGRIAAHKTNTKPVIYTAHGFHFYKGAPVFNWLFFYPVERGLAHWTDCLITINKEDYRRARNFQLKNNQALQYIPGIGIKLQDFQDKKHTLTKKDLDIPEDSFLIMSTGELNKNKNQRIIIEALRLLDDSKIHYILCGEGKQKENLYDLCKKYHLENQVHFLGFRSDINQLLKITECFVFPSKREGIGVAALEAIATGVPVVAAKNRATREYIFQGKNGFLCDYDDSEQFAKQILRVKEMSIIQREQSKRLDGQLIQKFGEENNKSYMRRIYKNVIRESMR